MKCPKCHYISFDSGDRCRNCGYEFSLVAPQPPVDVKIGRDEPAPGRVDAGAFSAGETPLSPPAANAGESGAPRFDAPRRRPLTADDLPLFTERIADDQAPLVTPPAVPRPPLSVRRANPNLRGRTRSPLPDEPSLDLAADPGGGEAGAAPADVEAADTRIGAGVVRRLAAGLIDVAVLGLISWMVVYLTLRFSGLAPAQWRILPLVPIVAFLLLLYGGYFVLFTAAGGQTIGKMTTGIRVVEAPEDGAERQRVSFGTAVVRTCACLGSVLLLGAGFLPVLFSKDRRAFHDRVAETRVVPV